MRFSTAKSFAAYVAEHGANFGDDLDLGDCIGLKSLPARIKVEGCIFRDPGASAEGDEHE